METKDYNESLRQSLIAYMTDYDLSLSDVARDIGYSSSTISKYRSGKPEGDISKLEGLLTDIIAGAATRQTRKYEIFTHHITDLVREVCDIVRGKKRARFGLLTGPAGLGKTKGLELFALNNPTTILVTIQRKLCADPKEICRSIIAAGEHRSTKGASYTTAVEKLEGTRRLLIIDNAHLLSKSGLGWLFDLYDRTGSPILLSGNPEVIRRIKDSDQQFSRIGFARGLSLIPDKAKKPAENIIHRYFPDHVKQLAKLATQVVEGQGHFRALDNQLSLAQDILSGAPDMSVEDAFRAAHTRLVRNYDLD
jgi:DNA transposition AAA+ family ATPase